MVLYLLLDIKSFLRRIFLRGPIAQIWLERAPDKGEVVGSTPTRPIFFSSQFPVLQFCHL